MISRPPGDIDRKAVKDPESFGKFSLLGLLQSLLPLKDCNLCPSLLDVKEKNNFSGSDLDFFSRLFRIQYTIHSPD